MAFARKSRVAAAVSVCLLLGLRAGRAWAGADVVTNEIGSVQYNGTVGTIHSYSVGTAACNIGDVELEWFLNTNRHPVIATNLYRLKVNAGSFEQIGQSWLKHGWCAADTVFPCAQAASCTPNESCNYLGLGCYDVYDASLNAYQDFLGPKSEVNPVTGLFQYPFYLGGGGAGGPLAGDAIYKRLQVDASQVFTTVGAGALPPSDPEYSIYVAEAHYIHPQDAGGLDDNNVTWRRMHFSGSTPTNGFNVPSVFGIVYPTQSALVAWQGFDPAVLLSTVDVPGDGRFIVGQRVTDLGGGTYHYEYAVQNLNSHRAAESFTLALGPGAVVSNKAFHDVAYHSGEPYSGTDWVIAQSPTQLKWSCENEVDNANANALRWGTAYNFRFDCNRPPVDGTATLGIFRAPTPGSPDVSVQATVKTPDTTPPACLCPGDVDASNSVDGRDVPLFTAMYLGAMPVHACADLALPTGGPLDPADLTGFVNLLTGVTPPVCP